ncbi:50S ribosomal protein L24 [Francisella frigiditurris]|uniref:Large ribosomal subunit protein uL24 n=1 Tax=Francisella frigiditurris TaxID=1542390 RepID=A0A1J0KUH0_9GAMM|nr:50S ribosomal protein L24 [Francisella frigiditurris]APC97294.1 ribosomal protein L24 [Francisella frigiditurris]
MNRLKKGDDVIVIAGKDKGRRGTVKSFSKGGSLILVEGINVVKKHIKPNPNKGVEGGVVEKELPVHASNVAIYNPTTEKADRVGYRLVEENKKVRYFKSNGELVDL